MNVKKVCLYLSIAMALIPLQSFAQSKDGSNGLRGANMPGVPVMFGDLRILSGDGDGLTHGTGQFGAPTVSACYYDYRTGVIASFPANISSGWIETNQKSNPYCIAPGNQPDPNWAEMTYFVNLPVGTVLRVCWNGYSWPAGWTPVNYAWDASYCGYWASSGGVPPSGNPNVMYIRRDQ